MSSNISVNSEIERLSGEVKSQREKADFWDTWTIRFLFIAGFAAVCLFVTAVGASRSNSKLTDLRDELDKARDRSFETAIAQANSETAKLGKEGAEARLETEKLKRAVGWRTISQQTASELETALSATPGAVNLQYPDSDPEAIFFATQFSRILEKAQWRVAPAAVNFSNAVSFGISLPSTEGTDGKILRKVFSAAKIPYSTKPLPIPVLSHGVKIDGAPILMIGSKPPSPLP